eukprot:CAMPEP_0119524574 /NCGR_PEP_ID=MMETSP1344-20130328/39487_1 /TAXON_ID=236787 /ORGANISM="Florenciella parvula, Strain CCMP2471" /LENGTH=120 /DNA_ID=CAMNT_0007563119 /DNA_START=197 /DNA_END=559 /DNA_ORIENTATION=-
MCTPGSQIEFSAGVDAATCVMSALPSSELLSVKPFTTQSSEEKFTEMLSYSPQKARTLLMISSLWPILLGQDAITPNRTLPFLLSQSPISSSIESLSNLTLTKLARYLSVPALNARSQSS